MLSRKLVYWLIFYAVFSSVGCNFFAQEDQLNDINSYDIKLKMGEEKFFFDALRLRTDLNFESQKRILYTTIKDIKAFRKQYRGSQMTMEYVIRDRLHTAIFLNQEKNYLESMDGTEFSLPENISVNDLTEKVVNLIGSMYYGAEEVRNLYQ